MALEHRTIIGGLQIYRTGDATIQFKLIVADGGEEHGEQNYRLGIEKGADVAARLTMLNNILVSRGKQPLGVKVRNVIINTLTACWSAMDA